LEEWGLVSELPATDGVGGSITSWGLASGVVLALSSSTAYAIAWNYEAGIAQFYGFPEWMIALDFRSVLLAWMGLIASLATWLFMAISLASVLPARTVRVAFLISWRAACYLVASLVLTFYSPFGAFRWLAVLPMMALALEVYVTMIMPLQRYSGPWIERWDTHLERRRWLNNRQEKAPSLLVCVSRWPSLSIMLAMTYFALLLVPPFLLVVKRYGRVAAAHRCGYAITRDSVADVALRHYGDNLVLARLTPDSLIDTTSFRLVPIGMLSNAFWTKACLTLRSDKDVRRPQ
jgi:hypothetical protein